MTITGRVVTLPVGQEADTQQAHLLHSLLAEHRTELCDRLDEQANKLARYERSRDSAAAGRKRRQIKEIGAEIRDVDRMMHALNFRLLRSQQHHQSN